MSGLKQMTPANIVIEALRGMRWRDFLDFEHTELPRGGINTQEGVEMAQKLADAIESGQASVVLGAGVKLR